MAEIEREAMEYDVVIVGAGFAGLYQLHELTKRGFSAVLLEAGADANDDWDVDDDESARAAADTTPAASSAPNGSFGI